MEYNLTYLRFVLFKSITVKFNFRKHHYDSCYIDKLKHLTQF